MKKSVKILLFCLVCILFIGCDRLTKGLAREHLMFHEPKVYLNNTVRLEYAENTGAILSLGDDLPATAGLIVLGILPLLFMLGLTGYVVAKINDFSNLKLLALCMIIAGGFGNVIDRLLYDRHVTDFMNLGIGSLRTGIFNVADLCVTTGVVIFIFTYKKDEPANDEVAVPE